MKKFKNLRVVVIVSLMICFYFVLAGSMSIKKINSKSIEKEEITTVKQESIAVVENETSEEIIEEVEKTPEIIPVSIKNAKDYIRRISEGTNLAYTGDITEYFYKGDVFRRFPEAVYFGDERDALTSLNGYDFILADDGKIWFIDDKRMISSYDYQNGETVVHESADLDTEPDNRFWYEKYQVTEGATAINAYNFPYTVVIDGNEIAAYGRKNVYGTSCSISSFYFPFEISELTSTYYSKYSDEDWKLNFISDTGVIGQLIFTADGVDYKIIDTSDTEKSLYYVEGNRVDTRGNWVVYYKDKELVASDGELTFSFDEMEYREMWLGDCCGLGRGYENFAAVLVPVDDYEVFNTMSVEELLDIYVF